MDVDNPSVEEAMETDPPPVEGEGPSVDPDGDEQMDAGEVYRETGDIEIGEGDELAESGEEVDADGDITPEEAEIEGDEYFYEDEGQVEAGDVEIQEGQTEEQETVKDTGAQESGVDAEAGPASSDPDQNAVATSQTTSVAPAPPGDTTEPEVAKERVEEQQADQGNVAVEPRSSEVAVNEVPVQEELETAGDAAEVVEAESEPKATEAEEVTEAIDEQEDQGEDENEDEVFEFQIAEVDEDDEEEDTFDHITYDTLPPILLHLPNAQRALFNPIVSEDGISPPIWFAEKVQEFSEGTLSVLWSAIRGKLDEEGLGNESDELVVVERLTDLKMGDSDVNLEDITFLDLVQMYHDCELPEPMELHLEFHPHRFITRFNAIQAELQTREVIYIDEDEVEDEDDEGEFGGDGEILVGDDEKHDDDQEDEVEEVAEGGPAEPAHTNTGQLPVPLPAEQDKTGNTKHSQDASEDAVGQSADIIEDGSGNNTEDATEIISVEATEVIEPAVSEAIPAAPATIKEISTTTELADTTGNSKPTDTGRAGGDARSTLKSRQDITTPTADSAVVSENTVQNVTEPIEASTENTKVIEQDPSTNAVSTEQIVEIAEETGVPVGTETGEPALQVGEDEEILEDGDAGETSLEAQPETENQDAAAEVKAEEKHPESEASEVLVEEGAGEEVEGGVQEEAEGEAEEDEEEEEALEGDETDPYGLDKLVGGMSQDAPQNGDHRQQEVHFELDGSEEVLEEYEEDADGVDATTAEPHGGDENDEKSPAKRSRSVEDDQEAAGKRVKLADTELVSETQ